MYSFYSCMRFLWEDSGTPTHWSRVGKAWHQAVHIFFPVPANRLHFCNRKTRHGDQEATTWPAQTFTLWTPAQTARHSLLSWGRSPSPTPTVPSIQSLPGGEAYHSSWLDKAPSTLDWLTMLFCDKKQQIGFASLMGFEAHCLQMDPAFLLKGVQNCVLFALRTPFCIPAVRGNTGSSCYVWLIWCTVICIRSWGSGNLLTVCLRIAKVI